MNRAALHFLRALGRGDGGSIAVEFALVAPFFAFGLAGVVDIGSAAYARLSLDARVSAAADHALMQSAPSGADAASAFARQLVVMVQGQASETAEVVVNNAARATWTGTEVAEAEGPGDAAACYCPTLGSSGVAWGQALDCGAPCASGDSAGRFVEITATARHVAFFPSQAFVEDDTVRTRTVLRLQ